MYRVVEIVRPKGTWCESRQSLVEEASIGRRVGHIGRKIDGRGVDVKIGRDIGHRGQKIVHHARIVGIVGRGSDKARLQDIAPEEGSADSHIVEVQQGSTIREHRIYIDVLDVRQVRQRVVLQIQISEMLYHAILLSDLVHSHADVVEGVAELPLKLAEHQDNAQPQATGEDKRRMAGGRHPRGEDVYSCD